MGTPEIENLDLIERIEVLFGLDKTVFRGRDVPGLLECYSMKNDGEPVLLVNMPELLESRDKVFTIAVVYPIRGRGKQRFYPLVDNSNYNVWGQYLNMLISHAQDTGGKVNGAIFAHEDINDVDKKLIKVAPSLKGRIECSDLMS